MQFMPEPIPADAETCVFPPPNGLVGAPLNSERACPPVLSGYVFPMAEFEHGWIDVLKVTDLTPVVQWTKAGDSPTNLNAPERAAPGQILGDKSAQIFSDLVGELGRDGWELIWVVADRHYFKRQLT